MRGPAQQGPQAGQQLLEREGFREIVVGAAVEAGDPIGELAARREHEHRHHIAAGAQLRNEREAVAVRQPPVEQHRVMSAVRRDSLGVGQIRSVIDHHIVARQSRAQRRDHLDLVFHQEDTHR